jgi:hypothetical protein
LIGLCVIIAVVLVNSKTFLSRKPRAGKAR